MGLPAVVVMKNPNERLAFSVSIRRGEQRWAGHAAVIAILTETSQAAPLRIAAKSAVEESGSFLEQDGFGAQGQAELSGMDVRPAVSFLQRRFAGPV